MTASTLVELCVALMWTALAVFVSKAVLDLLGKALQYSLSTDPDSVCELMAGHGYRVVDTYTCNESIHLGLMNNWKRLVGGAAVPSKTSHRIVLELTPAAYRKLGLQAPSANAELVHVDHRPAPKPAQQAACGGTDATCPSVPVVEVAVPAWHSGVTAPIGKIATAVGATIDLSTRERAARTMVAEADAQQAVKGPFNVPEDVNRAAERHAQRRIVEARARTAEATATLTEENLRRRRGEDYKLAATNGFVGGRNPVTDAYATNTCKRADGPPVAPDKSEDSRNF
jgi:hypothetical protein